MLVVLNADMSSCTHRKQTWKDVQNAKHMWTGHLGIGETIRRQKMKRLIVKYNRVIRREEMDKIEAKVQKEWKERSGNSS